MIFWDLEKLLNKLSSRKLSQKELFSYLFGLTLLDNSLSGPFLSESSYFSSLFEWFDWSIFLLSSLISIGVCFFLNGGNQGKDFIERYIAIQFVMTIRYLVFIIFSLSILEICGFDFENDRTNFVFSITFYLVFTFRQITNFKYLRNLPMKSSD